MPTVLTHAALPLIAALAVGQGPRSRRLGICCAVAAVIPDLDVAGRAFGVSSESLLGHRGISHSITAATAIALIGGAMLARRYRWSVALPCLFLSALSHGLTDMLTDGGKGIAVLWPISGDRLFAPFRPIKVSPILLRGFENGKLPLVLASELIWLIAPALFFALLVRRAGPPHIDLDKGQS